MSKAILPRKPAGKAKPSPAPRQRPNTAEERLKAMSRFRSYGAWLASLSPAERRNERRRLEAERRRGMPYPAATDADLTKLLYCVGTEWVRAFYPKARGASLMVSRPFGGGSDECVMLALDLAPDAPPVAPDRRPLPEPTDGAAPAGRTPASGHADPGQVYGATIDRPKLLALWAEAAVYLHHLHDRLGKVYQVLTSPGGTDAREWIDAGLVGDVLHDLDAVGSRMLMPPVRPEVDIHNPVEPIRPPDAKGGGS